MPYDAGRVVKELGERIAQLRRERGMSQGAFAEQIRATPQWVSQLERGTRSPTVDTIVKVANALGVTIPELFGAAAPTRVRRRK